MSKLDSERKNSAAPSGTPVEKDSGRKGIDEPSDFSDAPVQLPANGSDGFSEEFPLLSRSVEKEEKKSAGNNSVSSAPQTPESSKGGKTTDKTQSKKAPGTTGARPEKTATPRSSGSPNLTKKKLAPARRRNTSEKIVFILCMVLLAPLVLTLFTAVFLIFVFSFFLTFAVAGGLVLALVLLVVAGVVLSLTGITYGLIQLVSQEGFALLAGRYELGLGLAIAGVTVVLSALLYSGATGLIPFVMKKIFCFFRFVFLKLKAQMRRLYEYCTQI